MDQDRLTWTSARAGRALLPALGIGMVLLTVSTAGPLFDDPDRWTWAATALSWFIAALLMGRSPSVATLSALVGLAWVVPGLVGVGVLWHRGPLIHLLVTAGVWWPRSRAAQLVVIGGYVLSVATGGWVQVGIAVVAVAAIVVAFVAERGSRPMSLLRRVPWQAATALTAIAFVLPPALAWAGLGRAWALPVLVAYDVALCVVAVLVVGSLRPWARPDAADLAVELGGEPLTALQDALAPHLGDPDLIRRELTSATDAAIRLRARLDERQAELSNVLTQTQESWQRLSLADELARRGLVDQLEALAGDRLTRVIAELELVAASSVGSTSGAAQRAKLHLVHATEELDALGRGLQPAVLADGLVPALRQVAAASSAPVSIIVPDEGALTRLPRRIATVAYFATSEAVTNAVKHANATGIAVEVGATAAGLEITVVDDGVGGVRLAAAGPDPHAPDGGLPDPGGPADPQGAGMGLNGLCNRVLEVGGQATVQSPPGGGTSVRITLPVPHE